MKKQKGLTLIEMVIAISLLAIMISAIVFSFDGSKSRAQVLVAAMEEYTGALERLKTDASCYPRSLVALIDRAAAAGAGSSFCGADLSKQWNGPYVKAAPVKAAPLAPATNPEDAGGFGVISMAQLSPELTLRIGRNASAFGGGGPATWKWFIIADGVPSEILTQAMSVCNGTDDAVQGAASTGVKKCSLGAGSPGYAAPGYAITSLALVDATDAAPGSMSMLFAETRK